jgi:hypothetical protein
VAVAFHLLLSFEEMIAESCPHLDHLLPPLHVAAATGGKKRETGLHLSHVTETNPTQPAGSLLTASLNSHLMSSLGPGDWQIQYTKNLCFSTHKSSYAGFVYLVILHVKKVA